MLFWDLNAIPLQQKKNPAAFLFTESFTFPLFPFIMFLFLVSHHWETYREHCNQGKQDANKHVSLRFSFLLSTQTAVLSLFKSVFFTQGFNFFLSSFLSNPKIGLEKIIKSR